MRRVAVFETENHALRFWSFLKKQGVESSLENIDSDKDEFCEIWVAEEDQVSSALSYLKDFNSNPDDPEIFFRFKKRER